MCGRDDQQGIVAGDYIVDVLKGKKVDDFLPPPDQLVKRVPKVKVTITLNQQSVEFFKKSAKKNKVKYQIHD